MTIRVVSYPSLIGSGLIRACLSTPGECVAKLQKLDHDRVGLRLVQAEVCA